jgi:hypothetical protein
MSNSKVQTVASRIFSRLSGSAITKTIVAT